MYTLGGARESPYRNAARSASSACSSVDGARACPPRKTLTVSLRSFGNAYGNFSAVSTLYALVPQHVYCCDIRADTLSVSIVYYAVVWRVRSVQTGEKFVGIFRKACSPKTALGSQVEITQCVWITNPDETRDKNCAQTFEGCVISDFRPAEVRKMFRKSLWENSFTVLRLKFKTFKKVRKAYENPIWVGVVKTCFYILSG